MEIWFSLVSLPDFNLNKREEISASHVQLWDATKGVYEFGSVFKIYTLAAA